MEDHQVFPGHRVRCGAKRGTFYLKYGFALETYKKKREGLYFCFAHCECRIHGLKDAKLMTILYICTLNLGTGAHTMLFQFRTEVIFSDGNSSQHGNPFRTETSRQLRSWQSLTTDGNIRFILD